MTNVLLITDDTLLRNALFDGLTRHRGFSAAAAADGNEALRMDADGAPGILVADISKKRQAECLAEIDALAERFSACKLVLLDSKNRAFTRSFQNTLHQKHVMAYTYSRDAGEIVDLLESITENYMIFPGIDSPETGS